MQYTQRFYKQELENHEICQRHRGTLFAGIAMLAILVIGHVFSAIKRVKIHLEYAIL